jgi:glycerophosphoryl diester phosphodiesterase
MSRPLLPAGTPVTFAHRGGLGRHPENTVAAFDAALRLGARGLETDVRRSGDDAVVLRHDARVWFRVGGILPWRRRVDRMTSERLAALGIPRLEEVYAALGADYELSVDVMQPGMGPALGAVARALGDPTRLWLCSGSAAELAALAEAVPEAHLVHSQRRNRIDGSVERHAATLAEVGIDAMNMHHVDWSAGLVALFHRFGVLAFAWDVQEIRDLRRMAQIGIDAVYSDHVERMVETIDQRPA